jgi:Ca2+/Na+ antiporter
MISKSSIVIVIFITLFSLYLLLLVWQIHKAQKKREAFSEEKQEEEKHKKEAFADKQLEKNLFIINTFEDFYDRKITPEELKTFSEMFHDESVTEEVMKKKIESFEETKQGEAVSKETFVNELTEISQKLNLLINAIKNPTPKYKQKPDDKKDKSSSNVESFVQGHEPFSKLNKYMPL